SSTCWCADTCTGARKLRCRRPASRSILLTTSNLSIHGGHRWWREMRAAPMRKALLALSAVLAGCSTPAYRASEVPVPSAYGVDASASVVANRAQTSRSEDVSTPGVYVSPTLA